MLESYKPESIRVNGRGIDLYADETAKFSSLQQARRMLRALEITKRENKKKKN